MFAFCLLQYAEDKGSCEDLTEGQFTFPLIHAIKSHPDDNQVLRILLFQIHAFVDTSQIVTLVPFSVLHFSRSSYDIQHNLNHVANMYKTAAIYVESPSPWSYTLTS
jgi:hypothetical protein